MHGDAEDEAQRPPRAVVGGLSGPSRALTMQARSFLVNLMFLEAHETAAADQALAIRCCHPVFHQNSEMSAAGDRASRAQKESLVTSSGRLTVFGRELEGVCDGTAL